MKLTLFIVVVLSLISRLSFGQQNLFNIPSGDITIKGKAFYQHQFNLYNDKLESKAHFIYGLGKGWDAGMNLVGKGVYFSPDWRLLHNDDPKKGALYPILMGSLQKQFKLSELWDINIGSQVGYNLSKKVQNKEINFFVYSVGVYHFMKGASRIVGGIYQTNRMYVGQGNTFGVMFGSELRLSKRWSVMGDWVSGNNDSSVGVLGGMYNLTRRIQLCAGWQIPNPNTPKNMGLVLELNIMGWDIEGFAE